MILRVTGRGIPSGLKLRGVCDAITVFLALFSSVAFAVYISWTMGLWSWI
jgi:hypothetical protein